MNSGIFLYSCLRLKSLHSFRTLLLRDNASILVILELLLGKTTLGLLGTSMHDLRTCPNLTSLMRHLYSVLEYFASKQALVFHT